MGSFRDSWTSITRREQSILQLMAEGMSAKEAAIELDIAPRTVEKHIESLKLKIRAKNRVHLIALALSAGMIPDWETTP